MQNQKEQLADGEMEATASDLEEWGNFRDDDIMQLHSAIRSAEADKIPFLGYMEPLLALAAEYQSGSPILLEKIKKDILETQDRAEVDRIKANVEEWRKTLQTLGYADFTFEDFFFTLFLEQLDCVLQGNETSISQDELISRSPDQSISDYIVMFFRFVTSGEIRKRAEFFEPFIMGLASTTVEQFCKSSVEPMGEESDHVHITALSDALGVLIRVVYLDRSSCDTGGVGVNHHDLIPAGDYHSTGGGSVTKSPFITLVYRPGHYDILYSK